VKRRGNPSTQIATIFFENIAMTVILIKMPVETDILNLKKIKTFVILGFGKTAIATAKFLNKNFPQAKIKISELKNREDLDTVQMEELEKLNIEFEFGKQTESFVLNENNFIIISPGIPPRVELIQKILHSDISHGTDLDVFAACLSKEQQYVAITGTNGKTTTTSLVSHIFNSPSLGNIGTPFLEFDKEYYPNFACEISSFQAFYSQYFQKLKTPKISVFLNFTADHLDWHKDLNEYQASKQKLFCQSVDEENYWILNFDDPKVKNFGLKAEMIKDSKTKICYFSNQDISYSLSPSCPYVAYQKHDRLYLAQYLGDTAGGDLGTDAIVSVNDNDDYFIEIPLIKTEDLSLVGKHNYSNILAATLSAYLMKFDIGYIIDQLKTFKPVAHRLEFIREIGTNKVYNDSKATNPDSTLKAIDSFDQSILILGGKEKNLDLTAFLDRVSKKAYAVVAIGELKTKIHNRLREIGFDKVRMVDTLEEALSTAILYADNNQYPILLSPASSSFDMFKGFEDRGNQFREIVLKY
jgi:UDP-N-acetylmuramoylalanine--D-glutamate ligase